MSVHDDLHFLSKPNSRHQLSEIEIAGRPKLLVLWAGQLWQGHVWIEIWKVPTLGSTLQMMTDDGGQKKWRFRLWSFDRVNICCFLSLKWEKLVLGLDPRQPTLLAVWIWQGRKAMLKSRIGTYIGRVAREECQYTIVHPNNKILINTVPSDTPKGWRILGIRLKSCE